MKIKKSAPLSSIAPILIFAVFTACILILLFYGSNAYSTILHKDQNNFDKRTAVQYLTTRLHQNDSLESFYIGDYDTAVPSAEGDTLFCIETIDGAEICTRIYVCDGYLRELFAFADSQFDRNAGQKILPLEAVSFKLEEDLLSISLKYTDSEQDTLIFSLQSGKEAAHEK